jgi:glyoxylase-like metal-dependent hydrolase (beta-lactamase superfamily II)
LCVGDIRIYPLVDIPRLEFRADDLFPDSTPEALARLASDLPADAYQPATFGLVLQFRGFLLESAKTRVLVDSGVGCHKSRPRRPAWHQRGDRRFIDELQRVGISPAEVDVVVATHLHADHLGWHTQWLDGTWTPTFPRAQYVFARAELDYWWARYRDDPGVNDGSFADSVAPLLQQDRCQTVQDGHELGPGLTIHVRPGHTPGNALVRAESRGESAAMCGDLLHHPVQLGHPEWCSRFCTDPPASRRSRRSFLEEVAETGALVLPAHFLGTAARVARQGDGFRLESVEPAGPREPTT